MKECCVLLLCKYDGAHFQKQLQLGGNRLLGLVENDKQLERKLMDEITDCNPLLYRGVSTALCKGWEEKKKNQEVARDWQGAAVIQYEFKKQTNKTQK